MIAEILGTGRAAAKTAKDISSMLGMKVRDVSKAVQTERRACLYIRGALPEE